MTMRTSREPNESARTSPALRRGRHEPALGIETLVENAEVAARKGDGLTVSRVLRRLMGTMGDSSLAYLEDRLTSWAGSDWVREVRLAALDALALSHERSGDLVGARSALEDAFALAPGPGLLNRIVVLTARLDGPQSALDVLTPRLQQWPEDADLQVQAATLELDLDRYDAAAAQLGEASGDLGGHAGALAVRARLALLRDEPESALDLGRSVVGIEPSRGRAIVAVALNRLGRADDDPGLVTAALADLPSDLWVLDELGQMLIERGELLDAVRVYDHALRLAPNEVESLRGRGYARAALGELEAAADDLDRASAFGDDHWLTSMRGEIARLRGNYESAVGFFRSLPADEALPWVSVALGAALLGLNDDHGARQAFQEALDRDPDDAEALCGLAMVALQGDTDEAARYAEDLLRRAVLLDVDGPRTHALLGEALRRQGAPRDAVEEFDRALALDPAYAYAIGSKGQALLALGQVEQAIEALSTAASHSPDMEWILDELVSALQAHRPRTADSVLRKLQRQARESGKDVLPVCSRRALLAHQQQRWAEAEPLFEQVRALAPQNLDLAADHVDVLRHLGRRAEALDVINRLMPAPENHSLTRVRIDLLWSLNRLAEARSQLEAMNARGNATAQVVAALGECYRSEGRRDEALALLSNANQREPGQPYVLASLGAVELDQGNLDQARQHLTHALAVMPRYEVALGWLMAVELEAGQTKAAYAIVDQLKGETNPELVAVHATGLYELGEYSRAIEVLDEYLSDGGTRMDLIRLRGWSALAAGRRREAARNFTTAARGDTLTPQLLESVTSLVRVGQWPEALAAIDRANARRDPCTATARAVLELGVGSWGAAATHAQRGQEPQPTAAAAAMLRSRALRYLGQSGPALEHARLLRDLRPADPWSLFELAECLRSEGRPSEAADLFIQILDRLHRRVHLHSDDVDLQGMCLLRLGRGVEAAEVFLRLVTLTDQSARSLFNLLLASMLADERLQSEVLASRSLEELKFLSSPSLRGALARAAYELAVIAPDLPARLSTIVEDLMSQIDHVLPRFSPEVETLVAMNTDERNRATEFGRAHAQA